MTEQEDLASLLGEESKPIEFSKGLIGLEEWQQFVIITHPAGGPLRLLQSLQDQRMSLILANPYQITPNYKLTLSEADVAALQYAGKPGMVADGAENLDVGCIISVQEEPFSVTANLLGPLVINTQTGLGVQVILAESAYSARHPIVKPTRADSVSAPVEQVEEV